MYGYCLRNSAMSCLFFSTPAALVFMYLLKLERYDDIGRLTELDRGNFEKVRGCSTGGARLVLP